MIGMVHAPCSGTHTHHSCVHADGEHCSGPSGRHVLSILDIPPRLMDHPYSNANATACMPHQRHTIMCFSKLGSSCPVNHGICQLSSFNKAVTHCVGKAQPYQNGATNVIPHGSIELILHEGVEQKSDRWGLSDLRDINRINSTCLWIALT